MRLIVCEAGGDCEINRWSLVYENDANGAAVYGRLEDLVTALRGGAELTVYVASISYALPVKHVHTQQGIVCAQTKDTSKGWGSFHTDVYWWIFMLCTTGDSHMTRYYVGGTFYKRNDANYAVKWYVKYPQRLQPVLTQDATGQVVTGSVDALKEALRDGKAMYALVGNDSHSDRLPLTNVAVKNGHVAAQSHNRVSLKPCADGRCKFADSASLQSYILSTAGGDIVEIRRVLDTATREPDIHRRSAVSWLVDNCWTLALVHDGAGQVVKGSLDSLRDAVQKGHRVRVRLPGLHDYVAEADGVQAKNGVVSAYFLTLISDDSDTLPNIASDHHTHVVWMTVSTSGTVRMRWQKLGSVESGRKMHRVFDEVMWFVDTRPWTLVLSVDARGAVTDGRKEALAEAVKRGASVRYAARTSETQSGFVAADNMQIKGNDVDAQNNNHISLTAATDNANDIDFQNNPYWYFTLVTTTGTFEASRWTYGRHESRGRDVKHFPVDWFVSY